MSDIGKAVDEMKSWYDMLEQRFPDKRDEIQEKRAETATVIATTLNDIFGPLIALGEGHITADEYRRLHILRDAEDQLRRLERYGRRGPWEVDCAECGTSLLFEDEVPPLYATCEDLDGESCEEDEDDYF